MTTNFIHHQLADPHNIHTRANLKFHEQMRLMETATAAATTKTKRKQRLGGGKGIEQVVEVEQEKEFVSFESESASSATVAVVATTESSSVSIDKNIPGGETPTDQSQLLVENEDINEAQDPLHEEQPPPPPLHELSGLSCHDHNGPYDDMATAEMVYWKDIPSDSSFKSPIGNEVGNRKYLTFEPDGKRQ
jgi:hypothetical protein